MATNPHSVTIRVALFIQRVPSMNSPGTVYTTCVVYEFAWHYLYNVCRLRIMSSSQKYLSVLFKYFSGHYWV